MQPLPLLRPRTSLPTAKAFFVSLPTYLCAAGIAEEAPLPTTWKCFHLATWTCHGRAQHDAAILGNCSLGDTRSTCGAIGHLVSFFDMFSCGSSHKKALTFARGD